MEGMDRWDWVLLLMAVYVAVVVLVRLMAGRRDKIIAQLRDQIRREQQRKQGATSDGAGERGDEAA